LAKHLVLGVSGGIAVYKVPDLISRLRKQGIFVEVIMTDSATKFVTPLTFREISQHPVHIEMFPDQPQWQVEHIALAKKADGLAIIPATANIIGKIAAGLADDLLTATVLASKAPKLIAPAMNSGMYENSIFQRNLAFLAASGFTIVGPDHGHLLCGDEGIGRLATLEELEINIEKLLTPPDLAGETVLVTAGGTREPIDPVRFLGNRSSGKMGHALAEAAFKRGARVFLVTTAEPNAGWNGMLVHRVETTAEMREKVLELAREATLIIKAAAPADFRPEHVSSQKIKKSQNGLELKLAINPDILFELGKRKSDAQIVVGFAAETESLPENAVAKLNHKNLDLIIGNLVNRPGIGMGAENNQVTIYSKNESVKLPEMPKKLLADKVLDYIIKFKSERVLKSS
jgi:phosphopantothenoylcysteine decarboxylase / phosphopantothenate---cysteine ligase